MGRGKHLSSGSFLLSQFVMLTRVLSSTDSDCFGLGRVEAGWEVGDGGDAD